jgi:hypothetical protein
MDKIGSKKRLFHILQDLDIYAKSHIGDCSPAFLREKLRFLHRNLEPSKVKSAVRGILSFFTRWGSSKIWTKTIDILNFAAREILERDNLISKPFITHNRITGPIDIIPFDENFEGPLQIKSENI